MTATLNDNPEAGDELEAVDVTQLLEVLRRLTNIALLGTFAATFNSPTTTFTALGGTSSVSFTKVGNAATTDILVFLAPTAFKTTATVIAEWAIGDGTTDRRTHAFQFNTLSEHISNGMSAVRMISLAAGTYTLQVKARCQSAVGGGLVVNTGDNISLLAMEVPV